MKKIILVLVLLALVMPAFADDAKVLPAGVLRTYIVPVYSFATQQYDADGEAQDIELNATPVDKVTLFNLGGAIEYGVNDWISAAVQWTPGQTFTTKFDIAAGTPGEDLLEENVTAKGPAEVFAGAKFQIVGPKAPVKNDMFRVSVATGVMIPAAFGYDPVEEDGNDPTAGDAFNLGVSKNAMGLGGRFYADYVINEMFFFNLYSQFKYYLPVAAEKTDYLHWATADAFGAEEVDYGYELTLEVEPHFNTMVADGVELAIGVPVTYVITPAPKYDDETYEELLGSDQDTMSLYVKPSVSAFMMKFPLPMEFKLGYEYPLMGKNVFARNNVVFQLKAYAKF